MTARRVLAHSSLVLGLDTVYSSLIPVASFFSVSDDPFFFPFESRERGKREKTGGGVYNTTKKEAKATTDSVSLR